MTFNAIGAPRPSLRGRSAAATQHQARLATLRQENKERVAEWLRSVDFYSTIAEISAGTGLSKPTVKERLTDLEATGVVREVEKLDSREQGSGRPASRYTFDANSVHVIGIDFGEHSEQIAFANLAGEIVLSEVRDADPELSADARLEQLHAHIVELEQSAPRPIGRRTAVGVAISGTLSRDNRLLYSSAFPEWQGANVEIKFADKFGGPVIVEHDLGAASVAENRMGSAEDTADFVLATVSRQVAASFFLRGEVYRGSHGLAGEVIRSDSGAAAPGPTDVWASAEQIAAIVAAAEAGDAAAAQEAKELAVRAGEQLAALIVTLDPEALYLHGPVTELPYLVDLVREQIPARVGGSADVPIKLSALGAQGPVLGVTLLALARTTSQLVGATASSPRQLYQPTPEQSSQSSQERTD